jgi:hypothetical protein
MSFGLQEGMPGMHYLQFEVSRDHVLVKPPHP